MTHPILLYDTALVYEGLAAYEVREEGLSGEVYDLVTYIVVTCNDETSLAAAESVMHRKFLQATVTFVLKVRGVKIIT